MADKAPKTVWTNEERAAMLASAKERKKSGKLTPEQERAEGEADVQAKIADMPDDGKPFPEGVRHECFLAPEVQ